MTETPSPGMPNLLHKPPGAPSPKVKVGAYKHPSAADVIAAKSTRGLAGAEGGNIPLDEPAAADGVRRLGNVTVRVLDAELGRMEVTDRTGRVLTVQRLSEVERFDLFEAFGANTPNPYTVGMASIAATLRTVRTPDGQGTGRAFPKNMTHIRGAIALLGEAGMDAVRTAFSEAEPKPVDDDGATPDADGVMPDGSLAAAKN